MTLSAQPNPHFLDADWWRHAVVYQVYPRSFADGNNDGTGDVAGIIDRLDYLAELGVDALWISPWYPSPLLDGGYDVADYRNISPDFGTLEDADRLLAAAHARGLRVLIDLVPNHSSWDHPWFRAALASPEAPERELYIFRDGQGPDGDEPPSNWGSLFGGSGWERTTNPDGTPGQYYLHMFDVSQPDWDWANPAVQEEFASVLRFWFDRGVDGFRIDVADSMVKDTPLTDLPVHPTTGFGDIRDKSPGVPEWDRPGLEAIQRQWRAVADSYANTELGARIFVAEAYLNPPERLVRYLEPGRLNTTFNFDALLSAWTADSQRAVITTTLPAHAAVGAPATWVLGNHDQIRVASRYGKETTGLDFAASGLPEADDEESMDFSVSLETLPTDIELGRRRARAAALLELALPGGAYIYQGEELGLDQVEDLPEEVLQDPVWEKSGHEHRGRDGCRVPIPWSGTSEPFGFSASATPWLPMPAHWRTLTVEAQESDPDSTLNLYRRALHLRRTEPELRTADFAWHPLNVGGVLAFTRGTIAVMVNFGENPVDLPAGAVLVCSGPVTDGRLGRDTAAWIRIVTP